MSIFTSRQGSLGLPMFQTKIFINFVTFFNFAHFARALFTFPQVYHILHLYYIEGWWREDSLGSRAPRATCHIPLEPSGPRDSRAPGAPRARARARREKLIFWPQIPTCGVSLEPGWPQDLARAPRARAKNFFSKNFFFFRKNIFLHLSGDIFGLRKFLKKKIFFDLKKISTKNFLDLDNFWKKKFFLEFKILISILHLSNVTAIIGRQHG